MLNQLLQTQRFGFFLFVWTPALQLKTSTIHGFHSHDFKIRGLIIAVWRWINPGMVQYFEDFFSGDVSVFNSKQI